MDRIAPSESLVPADGINHKPSSHQIVRPSYPPSGPGQGGVPRPVRLSKRVMSAIEDAQPQAEGKGVEIVLHSNIVSGKDLKRALEEMFPGPQEYFVQLRRDRYRITLPNHNKEDLRRYVSK